jgi:LysR family transcriptional regulator, hca operon transcriptional activator
MDLRYLRFFIAVAEEMNFTRAAERLHTVQPSVSRQIHRLEEIVGTPLFHRERHKLGLTQAGRVFLTESRAVLEHVNRAIELARQSARADAGQVAIGFILGTESQIFPRIVPALRHRYPDIELSYRALTEFEQFVALESGSINAAFTAGPIENPAIAAEFVMHQRLVVVLPSHHPLARLKRIPVARLAEFPLIHPTAAMAPNYVTFVDKIAQSAGVQFKRRFEHDNVLSALNSVSIGAGVCLVPDYQKGILPSHLVVRPLDLNPQPSFDLLVAYRKDDRLPALSCFLTVVRECMNKPFPAMDEVGDRSHAQPDRSTIANPPRRNRP